MRIAVLTSLYPTAVRPVEGLFAERRWTRMLSRGHEVRVVHPLPYAPRWLGPARWTDLGRAPAREERGGIVVLRPRFLHVPSRARANARRFARAGVVQLLAGTAPEVVVADYAWPAALAAEALRSAAVPFVLHGRGSDVLQVAGEAGLGDLLAAALRCAGSWCAVSRDLVSVMDDLGGRPGRGVLTPNGVDLELFRPRERSGARTALGLAPDGELVLVVGHLIPRKDPLLALRAFHVLAASRPAARLAFVGRGPLRQQLEAEVRRLGLGPRVQLVAEQPPEALTRWYAAADVLLLASWREGRPNVVLEALASGLPVVATPGGGTAELVEGIEGALCERREPPALALHIGRILDRRPPPDALRARVLHLSWDTGLEALEGCLARAIQEARAA